MWNAGTTPARMIEVISPAGFEGFFRECRGPDGRPSPRTWTRWRRSASAMGSRSSEPDWLPDVIARYGLDAAARHVIDSDGAPDVEDGVTAPTGW